MQTTEKKNKVHLEDLHFEHHRWTRELEFYRDEINVFRARLTEVARRYSDKEILKELEHFHNQFLIQEKAIHDLKENIEQHEITLARYAKLHPVAIDHVLFDDHSPIREKVERARDILNDLKKEFHRYLAKWM